MAQELPMDAIAADHVAAAARLHAPDTTLERVRGVLGALGLRGDAALRPIAALSGGEKARVALAALVLQPAPVLLLDEPSNHADAASCAALGEALSSWRGGCAVVVTHNRGFGASLEPTHVLRVAGGRARLSELSGPLTDIDWVGPGPEAAVQPSPAAARAAAAAKTAAPNSSFDARKKAQREAARLEKCLALIEAAEAEMATLDDVAGAAFQAKDGAAADKALKRKQSLSDTVDELFDEAAALEVELAAGSAAI